MRYRFFAIIFCIYCSVTSVMASSGEQIVAAREAYSSGDYNAAIAIYEQLCTQGEAPELYYNLANAYYKNNQMGKAVLNYERALRLDRNYEDAKFNLQLANARIQDKIDPIPQFFLTQWVSSLRALFSSNAWSIMSVVLFVLMLLGVLGYVLAPYKWMRKTSFFVALFACLFSIATLCFARAQKQYAEQHAQAIVLEGSVTVKSSPDESGTELFVVHEGTKVSVKGVLNEWVEVVLADGNVGWIKAQTIERI